MKQDVRVRLWSLGLMEQPHPGLLGSVTRFAVVAWDTCAGDVLPDVGATPMARQHMVNGEVLCLFAAVLADMTVSEKHLLSGEPMLLDRAFNHVDEPDHCRDIKDRLRRMKFPSSVLQHLRFASTKEDYCAADVADVEGFIVLVQKQHR